MIGLVWPVSPNSQLVRLARCTWQSDLDCCARSSQWCLVRWSHEWFLTSYIGSCGYCATAVVDTTQSHGSYRRRWSWTRSWLCWATTDSIRQQRSLGNSSSSNTSPWLSCRPDSACTQHISDTFCSTMRWLLRMAIGRHQTAYGWELWSVQPFIVGWICCRSHSLAMLCLSRTVPHIQLMCSMMVWELPYTFMYGKK